MGAEMINTHIKPTESTTLAKLSVMDQIKLMLSKFSNNDADEIRSIEKASSEALKMKASLNKLISTATNSISDGTHTSATLQLSSKYLPYLYEVIDEKYGLGKYYTFKVFKKDLPASVNYKFTMKIERKVS